MSDSSALYNSEVSAWLKDIEPKWYILSEICKPENEQAFIGAVKAYIDDDWGDVYFDTNYTKLRKIEILDLKPEITET